ncbi:MAG: hypothetical protein H8E30_19175 [Alphaproteobacteria bacterium]|nr:hypothetical protein [Alphaproteobacteria bacterium]
MENLFTQEYQYLWVIILTIALFFPVRRLIWVMAVRRAIRKGGEENVSDAEQERLKRRAGITSVLLCFLFSLFYVSTLFKQ